MLATAISQFHTRLWRTPPYFSTEHFRQPGKSFDDQIRIGIANIVAVIIAIRDADDGEVCSARCKYVITRITHHQAAIIFEPEVIGGIV